LTGNIIYDGVISLVRSGLVEILIFALVYVTVYGILRKIGLFAGITKKDKDSNDKDSIKKKLNKVSKVHSVIALVSALISIMPSFYAPWSEYNIVPIITTALPQMSLMIVGILASMLLIGILGFKIGGFKGNPFRIVILIGVIIFIFWIFTSRGGNYDIHNWISRELLAVVISIVVFALIVSWVMAPEKEKKTFKEILGNKEELTKEDWKKIKRLSQFDDFFTKR
jgi:hypothetical protein